MKKMKLSECVENPDNPSKASDADFKALIEKLRRNPNGLKADRIAYVTDHSAGKFVVLQGCKRLRALKVIYGDKAEVPGEWFQDVTDMTEQERNEFVVVANVNDGKFDPDKVLELYTKDELTAWIGGDRLGELIALAETPSASGSEKASEGSASGEAGDGATEKDGMVELKIKLSSSDYERAVVFLRAKGNNMEKRFMEVIRERA